MQRGKVEGRAEGKAELLIRLATLKFGPLPPSIDARIHDTASVELDSLGERLLDAATLDEWLGPDREAANGA